MIGTSREIGQTIWTRHNNAFHTEPRVTRVLKSMSFAAAR